MFLFYAQSKLYFKYWLLVLFALLVSQRFTSAQSSTPPTPIWDIETLDRAPAFSWLDQTENVHSLLYRSVEFEGKPTDVFAYYSNPDILFGKPSSGKRFPALVLVHGGGGTAFREWVEKWAAEGYAAIAMDLSGRDGRGERLTNAGPGQGHEEKFTKIEKAPLTDVWTYHAIASVVLAHSWLLQQPEVDTGRTGITGISWGGYLTSLAGAIDHRFAAAVPVYGCGFYNESDVFGPAVDALSGEGRKKWMTYFDPSVYLPQSKTQFLFLNGNKDKFYNVIPYHKTYQLVAPERRKVLILPNMKHSHYHGWEPHEIKYYFDHLLLDKAPLPTVGRIEQSKDKLTTSYASPVALHSADFYYTNDLASPNETRNWSVQKAAINAKENRLTLAIPAEGFKFGFFHVIDNRAISGSSEFIISQK
jgi:dienelactone hydrolase